MKQGAATRPDVSMGFAWQSRAWDQQLGCWAARIQPGEFYITSHHEAITTVLGSCISACIRDPQLGIGGMNHFMLPEDTTAGKSSWLDNATGLATRYGSYAMEALINALLKMGANRSRLEVKLFGGGHVLNAGIAVGERNIEFARTGCAPRACPSWPRTSAAPRPGASSIFPPMARCASGTCGPSKARRSPRANASTWVRWRSRRWSTTSNCSRIEAWRRQRTRRSAY